MINAKRGSESWTNLRALSTRNILGIVEYCVSTSMMEVIAMRTWEKSCKKQTQLTRMSPQ